MVEKAYASIDIEQQFIQAKKDKAKEVMMKQWEEQMKLKSN